MRHHNRWSLCMNDGVLECDDGVDLECDDGVDLSVDIVQECDDDNYGLLRELVRVQLQLLRDMVFREQLAHELPSRDKLDGR